MVDRAHLFFPRTSDRRSIGMGAIRFLLLRSAVNAIAVRARRAERGGGLRAAKTLIPDALPRAGSVAYQASVQRRCRTRPSRLRIERRAGVPSCPAQLPRPGSELIAHGVELMRDGEIKALPGESIAPVCLPLQEACDFHAGSPQCSSIRWLRRPRIAFVPIPPCLRALSWPFHWLPA